MPFTLALFPHLCYSNDVFYIRRVHLSFSYILSLLSSQFCLSRPFSFPRFYIDFSYSFCISSQCLSFVCFDFIHFCWWMVDSVLIFQKKNDDSQSVSFHHSDAFPCCFRQLFSVFMMFLVSFVFSILLHFVISWSSEMTWIGSILNCSMWWCINYFILQYITKIFDEWKRVVIKHENDVILNTMNIHWFSSQYE